MGSLGDESHIEASKQREERQHTLLDSLHAGSYLTEFLIFVPNRGGRPLKRRELFNAPPTQIPRPALPYRSCLVPCYLVAPTSSSLVAPNARYEPFSWLDVAFVAGRSGVDTSLGLHPRVTPNVCQELLLWPGKVRCGALCPRRRYIERVVSTLLGLHSRVCFERMPRAVLMVRHVVCCETWCPRWLYI